MTERHQAPISQSTDGLIHLAAKLLPCAPALTILRKAHTKKVHNTIIFMKGKEWPRNTSSKQ